MSRKTVLLGAAYMEEPVRIKNVAIFRHVNPQNLPITDALKAALKSWDEEYQATFDKEYPPDSGFASSDLEAVHVERGKALAALLQLELGDGYRVEYQR